MTITVKDNYFMKLAFEVAKASKCQRAHYGTVLVSPDGRIISTGYNGKPRGASNDYVCYRAGLPDNAAKPNCCLHSEANAIMFAGAERTQGATAYVSGIPCTDCALLLQQAGIARLVYYTGPNDFGHAGNFDLKFYYKYGMHYELVPYEARP